MPLGTKVGLSPGNTVFDVDPAPTARSKARQFSVHVCCGQMAGWINMPLCTKVGLCPGHIVLHGDPAAPPYGAQPPSFRPISLYVAKRSPISATGEHLFLPCHAMLARYAIDLCLSISPSMHLSVRLSVTSPCSIKTTKHTITQTTPNNSAGTLFSGTKDFGEIPFGVTPNRGPNTDE